MNPDKSISPASGVSGSAHDNDIIEELTCIVCPKSCVITVHKSVETGEITTIEHASCKRGIIWATREILDPVRVICSSVLVHGGTEPLAGVKTDRPIPRGDILKVMEVIRNYSVHAPVAIGDTVITDPAGVECRVVVTRAVPEQAS